MSSDMLTPTCEESLSAAIQAAQGPLVLRGGATRDVGRVCAGTEVDLRALSGVRLYEPGALTLVAGAGTPLQEIETLLAGENQRLAFEPIRYGALLGRTGDSTIGGVVASNASGPRRVSVGACRDHLLGVRFVDGAGRILSNGGRVMKNVTGYDLVKLMAGSWGTLGALSEVSLKVLPTPETQATLRIQTTDVRGAVDVMSRALGSPFEVSGAAFGPWGVALRIEGFEDQVRYRIGRLQGLLGGDVDPDGASIWDGLTQVAPFVGGPGDVWRIHVRPSQAADIVSRIDGDAVLDWGGALIWAQVPAGRDLRAALPEFDGHATLIRASGDTRARVAPFAPQTPGIAALSTAIRAQFDPRGIMNAGRMT